MITEATSVEYVASYSGRAVVVRVGLDEGKEVGEDDGCPDGLDVGLVGCDVGCDVGLVGCDDGCDDGRCEGCDDGCDVGLVGWEVG